MWSFFRHACTEPFFQYPVVTVDLYYEKLVFLRRSTLHFENQNKQLQTHTYTKRSECEWKYLEKNSNKHSFPRKKSPSYNTTSALATLLLSSIDNQKRKRVDAIAGRCVRNYLHLIWCSVRWLFIIRLVYYYLTTFPFSLGKCREVTWMEVT